MNGDAKSANGRCMRRLLGALGALLLHLFTPAAAEMLNAGDFAICGAGSDAPPAGSARCVATTIDGIDPQGRDIWVRAVINTPVGYGKEGPFGLFIAAKASSEAYLNGVRLGANGTPGARRDLETPGRMDMAYPIPGGVIRDGPNELMVRLSSHHGYLDLGRPVHWIFVGPYFDPVAERLTYMWPSLVALGIILSGALYFAVVAATGANRRDPILLSLLALFASGQLGVEIYRSLVAYPYPVHDLRLIAIVATSAGFALTLSALVISRFVAAGKAFWFAGAAILTALPIVFAEGFDAKAAFAILAATIACAALCAHAAFRGDRQGAVYAAALLAFAASVVAFQSFFLDAIFFFEVAALLLVLFAAQAMTLERERRESALERARAHELEAALERAAASDRPAVVRVNAAGSVNVVHAGEITHCKGAGDYVELHLADGRHLLHNGALAQMESELPPAFLRVHRSFIVNTAFVKTLVRESSGVGALVLSNGVEVPVSRRIMPKVRDALV